MIRVRMGAQDGLQFRADDLRDALNMDRQIGSGIDDQVTGSRFTDDVGIGTRARHASRVGRSEPLHIAQQRNGLLMLPVQRMQHAAVGNDQLEFAIRRFVLGEARDLAAKLAPAR